jgi:glycerol uptake facilitator-like aquaporin
MSGAEARRLAVEALGTAILSAGVIGAGLLAERFPGQLLLSADALVAVTGAALLALLMLTGARLNPALTLADAVSRRVGVEAAAWRAGAQVVGAILGVMAAHAVFDMGAIQHGGRALTGVGVWAGETGATFVFVLAVGLAASRRRALVAAFAGLTLAVVYLANPAMSLANPALLVARTLTDSYLGVRAGDAPMLVACQLAAATIAGLVCTRLLAARPRETARE